MRAEPLVKPSTRRHHGERVAKVSAMPGRSREDAALIARVRHERDRAALDALASHYGPRLKAWLMNRGEGAHTAEDIVQDIMVVVWLKADLFDPERGTFSTWAYRLARNKWIDHKRKNKRMQPMAPDLVLQLADGPSPAADKDYERDEMTKAVHEQLALLSPEQKQILHLAFFEGLTHSQIAERTGLALGTVKSRIRAPLKKMQVALHRFAEYSSE
jgi:RNA polymerase sigma-70 factor (ECF subfamily)